MTNHGTHGPHGNKAPESIRELIKKIYALSIRGVEGEAETAKRKLEVLLKKYNVTLEDIVSDAQKIYKFYYRTAREEQLIAQCYYSLGIESPVILCYKRSGRQLRYLGLSLTLAQYVDLKFMIAYYKTALKKEMDLLFNAFVQRHKLVRPPIDEQTVTKISTEEMARLLNMMRGLSEKSYFKPAGLIGKI